MTDAEFESAYEREYGPEMAAMARAIFPDVEWYFLHGTAEREPVGIMPRDRVETFYSRGSR